jgi:hypothetical protein
LRLTPQKTGLSAPSPRKRRCASCGLSATIPCAWQLENQPAKFKKDLPLSRKRARASKSKERKSGKGKIYHEVEDWQNRGRKKRKKEKKGKMPDIKFPERNGYSGSGFD